MDNKLKHLELIQHVINRLANSSFYLKGWTVIFVAAVLGFATKDSQPLYIGVAFIPTFSFWSLDGYYLNQERLFRRLYDAVRVMDNGEVDFAMSTTLFKQRGDWGKAVFSSTLGVFYGVILLVVVLVLLWQLFGQPMAN
ncbi:hypothetical protein C6495_17730 [Candidatus Poribacteria bacterium]|nr:MAG: hypothetical protein C6495_17730 [Candidatus Poribacteria bacterium]